MSILVKLSDDLLFYGRIYCLRGLSGRYYCCLSQGIKSLCVLCTLLDFFVRLLNPNPNPKYLFPWSLLQLPFQFIDCLFSIQSQIILF